MVELVHSSQIHSLVKPLVGASVAVWRDDKVLLIQRGREPLLGNWSFPGGRLEPGEQLIDAARRELLEETGLEVEELTFVQNVEMILRLEGALTHHIILALFAARWKKNEPVALSDANACRWATFEDMQELAVTQNLGDHALAAQQVLKRQN